VELFTRYATSPVIAITGSNGKSTVTALVGAMCRMTSKHVAVGGNIGVPVLDLIDPMGQEPDWYVLELSSFQLETTFSLNPAAATILNVSPDHMDRYPDINAYVQAKARIFHGQGVAVVNRDDPINATYALSGRRLLSFGISEPQGDDEFGLIEHQGKVWLARGKHRIMLREQVPLFGSHNLINVLAAMALASVAGVTPQQMVTTVSRFKGLPHRTELVSDHRGIRWVNDSKATNVGATLAALNGTEASVIWIAGGDAKAADFSPIRNVVSQRVRAAVLFGKDADAIAEAIQGLTPCHRASTLREAVSTAARLAQVGDVVLFSPACASLDMFENFEQRGEVFRQLVKEQIR